MKQSKLAPVVCACLAAFAVAHCGDDATPPAGGGNNCAALASMVPGAWRPVASGTTDNILSMWASAPDRLYIVGEQTLRRYNGTAFVAGPMVGLMDDMGKRNFRLVSIGGFGDSIVAGGVTIPASGSAEAGVGGMLRFPVMGGAVPTTSAPVTANLGPTELRMFWGSSATDIWAVGTDQAWHYDGTRWANSSMGITAGSDLQAIYGFGTNDLWAVGAKVYRGNGTTWA